MYLELKGLSKHPHLVPTDRDENSGRFQKEYPTERFLQAVSELDMATTSEVAEQVGCSYDLAYRRLSQLAEEDKVEKMDIGGTFIWQ